MHTITEIGSTDTDRHGKPITFSDGRRTGVHILIPKLVFDSAAEKEEFDRKVRADENASR